MKSAHVLRSSILFSILLYSSCDFSPVSSKPIGQIFTKGDMVVIERHDEFDLDKGILQIFKKGRLVDTIRLLPDASEITGISGDTVYVSYYTFYKGSDVNEMQGLVLRNNGMKLKWKYHYVNSTGLTGGIVAQKIDFLDSLAIVKSSGQIDTFVINHVLCDGTRFLISEFGHPERRFFEIELPISCRESIILSYEKYANEQIGRPR